MREPEWGRNAPKDQELPYIFYLTYNLRYTSELKEALKCKINKKGIQRMMKKFKINTIQTVVTTT